MMSRQLTRSYDREDVKYAADDTALRLMRLVAAGEQLTPFLVEHHNSFQRALYWRKFAGRMRRSRVSVDAA
jgi:hypothetical protein